MRLDRAEPVRTAVCIGCTFAGCACTSLADLPQRTVEVGSARERATTIEVDGEGAGVVNALMLDREGPLARLRFWGK